MPRITGKVSLRKLGGVNVVREQKQQRLAMENLIQTPNEQNRTNDFKWRWYTLRLKKEDFVDI